MGLPKLVTFTVFCLFAVRSEGGLYFRCPLHPCLCESGDMGLVMNCRQRFLTRIPPVIPSDLNFQELTLNKNNIRRLQSNAFKGIKVKKVDLSENIITDIAEDAFDGLENILEELVIQVYDMDGLPLNALRKLKALRVLHVIGCKVPVLANDTFTLVSNVEEIRLKTCGIEVVEPSAFRGLEKTLKVLDLFGNDLQTIPASSLIGLKNVNKMVLTGNHIETVDKKAFIGMSNLSHLELSSNGIQYIHPMAFDGTQTSLVFLGLQRNRLKGKDMEALRILHQLNQLELAYNQIESIPRHLFRKLNKLTLIGLQSNKVQRISRLTFAGTEQELKVLLLSDNLVRLIEPNTFRGFQKLRHLYLDRTSAGTGLSRQSFRGLAKSLETLNMQRSGFTASGFLAISELAELKTLVLRDNQITSLPPLIFSKLHRLSRLDLQSNRLQSIIDPQTFEGLEKSLRQLVLSNNMISTLSSCVFEKFEQLRDIVLNQNPLQCDCRIMWLKDWIISKTSMFSRNNLNWICAGPPRHTGKLFREVKDKEMMCSAEISRNTCISEKQRMLAYQTTTSFSTTEEVKSTHFTEKQNSSKKQINDVLKDKNGEDVQEIKHQLLLPDMKDPAFQQDLFYNDIIQRTVQLMASKLDDADQERPPIQRRRHRFKQPLNKMVTSHGRKRTLARWLSSTRRMYTKPAWVSRRPITNSVGRSSIRQEPRHSTRNSNQRRKSTRIPFRSRTVPPVPHRQSVKYTLTSTSDQHLAKRFTTKRRPTTISHDGTFTTTQNVIKRPSQVDKVPQKTGSLLNLTSAAASGRMKSTSDSSNSNRIRNPFLPPGVRGMWSMITKPSYKMYAVIKTTTVAPTTLVYLKATHTSNSIVFKIKEFKKSKDKFVKPTKSINLLSTVTSVSGEPNNALNSSEHDSNLNVTYKSRIGDGGSMSTDSMVTSPTEHKSSAIIVNQITSDKRKPTSSVPTVITEHNRLNDYLTLEKISVTSGDIPIPTTTNPRHLDVSMTHSESLKPIPQTHKQTPKMTGETTNGNQTVMFTNVPKKATDEPSQIINNKESRTHVNQNSSENKTTVVDSGLSPSTSQTIFMAEIVRRTFSDNDNHYSTTTKTKSNQSINLQLFNSTYTSHSVLSTLPSTQHSTLTSTTVSTTIKSAQHGINNTAIKFNHNQTVKSLNASPLIILHTTETIPRSTSSKQYRGVVLDPTASGEVKASTTVYMPSNYHRGKNNKYQRDKGHRRKNSPKTITTKTLKLPVSKSFTRQNTISTTLTIKSSTTPTRSEQYTQGNANRTDNKSHSENTSVSIIPQNIHKLDPSNLPAFITIDPQSSLEFSNSSNAENKIKKSDIKADRHNHKTSKDIKYSSPTEQEIFVSQDRFNYTGTNHMSNDTVKYTNESSLMTSRGTVKYTNESSLMTSEAPAKHNIMSTQSSSQGNTTAFNVTFTIIRAFTNDNITLTPSTVSTLPQQVKSASLPTKPQSPYSKSKVKPIDLRNPYTKENTESKYIYTGRPPTMWRNMTAIKNWLNSAISDKAEMYQNGSLESVKLSKPNSPPLHLKEGRIQNPYELLKNFKKMNPRLNQADAINNSEKVVQAQGKTGQKQHTKAQSVLPVNNTNSGENTSVVNIQKAEEGLSEPFNKTSGPRSQSNATTRNQDKDGTEANADQQGSVAQQPSIKPTILESNIVDIKDQPDNNRASGTTSANISQQLDRKVPENSSQIDATTEKLAENEVISTVLTENGHTVIQSTTQTINSHTINLSNITRSTNTSAQGRILHDMFFSKNSTHIDRYNIPDFAIYVSILPYATNAVKIKWNVSHDEKVSGFRVYYGEADNDTLLEGPSLAGNVRTYDITSLLPMHRYTFCVVAYLYKREIKKHGQCKELTIEFEEELKTVSSEQRTKTLALIIGSYGAGALVLVTLLLSIALLVRRYRDKTKTGLYVPRASPYWIEFLCGGFATSRYSNTVLDSSTATVSSGVEMSENDSHSDSDESGTYSFDYSLRSLPAQHIWSTADLHTNLYTY